MGYVPPSSQLKFDSNGNVLANLNAQNINPTIANPYTPSLLSHQTGLSVTASTASIFYSMGSSISIPRNGIIVVSLSGHVSGGEGYIQLILTRGSATYDFGSTSSSLFANSGDTFFSNTSSSPLLSQWGSGSSELPYFFLPVYTNDSLQFYGADNSTNAIIYIDDVLVMLI
ncbi:MAG: hypothetical protein QXP04_03485 [Candidatus Nanoarchaeia archaeon]|nr:hypothetical protein [Candidatus Jingweiarchaeum tengchongense]